MIRPKMSNTHKEPPARFAASGRDPANQLRELVDRQTAIGSRRRLAADIASPRCRREAAGIASPRHRGRAARKTPRSARESSVRLRTSDKSCAGRPTSPAPRSRARNVRIEIEWSFAHIRITRIDNQPHPLGDPQEYQSRTLASTDTRSGQDPSAQAPVQNLPAALSRDMLRISGATAPLDGLTDSFILDSVYLVLPARSRPRGTDEMELEGWNATASRTQPIEESAA